MKYYNLHSRQNELNQLSKWQVFLRATLITVIVAVGALVYIILDLRNIGPTRVGKSVTAVNESYRDFTTDYFTFRAIKDWDLIQEESSDKVFVYKKTQSGLYTAVFKVSVDQSIIPEHRRSMHVVPFSQDASTFELSKSGVSSACSSLIKDTKEYPLTKTNNVNVSMLTYEGASFPCWADSQRIIAVAAIKGGDDLMKLRRPNGAVATYRIMYEDVRNQSLQYGTDGIMFDSFELK